MKRDRIIYWISTGVVCTVMTASAVAFAFFDKAFYPEGGFVHMQLPNYFRIELTIAKLLGVLAILLPNVPQKIREFAYFGFGITLVSASYAHFSVGDGVMKIIDPLIFLGLLIVSYRYSSRVRFKPVHEKIGRQAQAAL